jgi:dimethylhistidine N-methyltransferase
MTTGKENPITYLKQEKLEADFAGDIRKGLSATPKRIPSKYFYDDEGSRIFQQIMDLDEYYPTRCEQEIFENHKEDLLVLAGDEPFDLVDLGAGDAEKTGILLRYFCSQKQPFTYVPIDISPDILKQLMTTFGRSLPELEIHPISAEYFDALGWLKTEKKNPKLVLFMGGNIGNFAHPQAVSFLKRMHDSLNAGDLLLMGIDLKKDPRVIRNAYDDSKGITARFNINLLTRINRELGADFNLDHWQHFTSYDPVSGAMQSFLISTQQQDVDITALNESFCFEAWEPVHTEYSIKYSPGGIRRLAADSGFTVVQNFTDGRRYFVDSIWSK